MNRRVEMIAAVICAAPVVNLKYPTGKSSEVCFKSHLALADDWHLGQWRLGRLVSNHTPLSVSHSNFEVPWFLPAPWRSC
jgi:hypothetical protein